MSQYTKEYLIPTEQSFDPIRLLIECYNLENINTLIYNHKFDIIKNKINNGDIIIKIIKSNSHFNFIEYLYKYIKHSQHIVKIYNCLYYNTTKSFFNNEYRNIMGLCNENHNNCNQFVTLEIMEKYDSSLNKYDSSLKLKTVIHIIKYLVLVQLELFNTYGFVHNNIKLTNIFIKKNPSIILFDFNSNKIRLKTNIKLYFTDFEHSLILFSSINPKIKEYLKNIENKNYNHTLENNILNTFHCCLKLLKNNKFKMKLQNRLEHGSLITYSRQIYYNKTKKVYDDYCCGKRPELNYKSITNIIVNDMISSLFKLLFKQYFLEVI